MREQLVRELKESLQKMNSDIGKRVVHNHMTEPEKEILNRIIRDMRIIRNEINLLMKEDLFYKEISINHTNNE
jgi:hypothetical protein